MSCLLSLGALTSFLLTLPSSDAFDLHNSAQIFSSSLMPSFTFPGKLYHHSYLWEPIFTTHISSFNIVFAVICVCVCVSLPIDYELLECRGCDLFIFVSLTPSTRPGALCMHITRCSVRRLTRLERKKGRVPDVSGLLFLGELVGRWQRDKEQWWKSSQMDSVSFIVFRQCPPGTGQWRLFSRQPKYSFGQREGVLGGDADLGTRCCARLLDF